MADTLTTAMVRPSRASILAEYHRLGLRPISGGDHTNENENQNENESNEESSEESIPDGVGDAGKAAIQREREARKAAAKRAKAAEERLAALEQAEAERAAAKQKADEEEAVKRGEFERLATERATLLEAEKQQREALAARVQAFEDRERQRIDAGLAAIPDDLKAFDPGADAPLDQRAAWFDKAAALAAERAKTAPTNLRTPQTPRPNPQGLTGADDAAARARAAAMYRG